MAYWITIATIIVLGFLTIMIVYYVCNLCILNSNQAIHEQMIDGILKSPSNFFDTTPSGELINKFSNDLSILDNNLFFTMIDSIEGPMLVIVALVYVCTVNVFFIPSTVIFFTIGIILVAYSKQCVVSSK